MSKNIFCLDFGTSTLQWSKIAVRRTATEPLPPAKTPLPNALRVTDGQLVAFGDEAAAAAPAYPQETYSEYKMYLNGDENQLWNGAVSPESLAQLAFRWLAEDSHALKSIQFTKKSPLVIGVPGHWATNGKGRKVILAAADKAGIKTVHLVPEPYAAMLWWLSDNPKRLSQLSKNDFTMVYDFGGGTLDIALFSGPDGTDDLKYGAHVVGGKDFDAQLLEHVVGQIAKKASIQPSNIGEGDRNAVLSQVRNVKERLSREETAYAEVSKLEVLPEGWDIELERFEFEKICAGLLDAAVTSASDTMKRNKVEPENIKQVILTGGSSSIFCLAERLQDILPHLDAKAFVRTRNPQHDVAKGLAVFGLEYYLAQAPAQPKPPKVSDQKIRELVNNYAVAAGAAALLNPIPILDLLSGVGINFKLAYDISKLFGKTLGEREAEELGKQILQCLAGMGVVFVISSFLKIIIIGAFLQAAVAGYITLITGLAVAEYFKRGQSWGSEGIEAVVGRIKEQNPPIETMKIIAKKIKQQAR